MGHDTAARLGALTDAVAARTRDRGPTIGDMPNGVEIARQLAVILALEGSTDPRDQQRVRVSALKAGALMPRPGHPEHPDAALLGAIMAEEESGGERDDRFWQAVGGRPECNEWRHAR